MGKKDNFTVIEQGSGDGILARDVIEFSTMINKTFGKSLDYIAIDKTPKCNTFQEIKTYEAISHIKADVYLSNELLDSIPVHRFVVRASQLKEIFAETPSPTDRENFKNQVMEIFGYKEKTAFEAVKYMEKNKMIKILNNQIYPTTLNKTEEAAHIVLKFPNGIFWKDIEIQNNEDGKPFIVINQFYAVI